MAALWKCPRCGREFRRANQRHSCGTGSRADMLSRRPPDQVRLYRALERALTKLEGVEIVTRDRYALFRTSRIFADLVFMKDALRLAIHLGREVKDPRFFKIGHDRGHVSHVVKLRNDAELRAVVPYLKEAWRFSRAG